MLELYLEQDEIDSSTFKKVLDSFYDFVEDITTNVAGKEGAVKWNVKVKEGGTRFLNYPYADHEYTNTIPDVYAYIKQGINILGDEAVRPEKYTDSILEKLQKLALLKKEGVTYTIKMDNEEVTMSSDSLIANINEVLGYKYEAYGSLEGKLQTISSKAGLRFVLCDTLTGRSVRCILKNDLLTSALKAYNKRVYMFGSLKYNSNNEPVSITVQKLRVFSDNVDIPTFEEMRGILKKLVMKIQRRYWDSNIFLAILEDDPIYAPKCKGIVAAIAKKEVTIVTSALTIAEVLYIKGHPKITREKSQKIIRFFESEAIIVVNVDREIAEMAREYIWDVGVHPKDAIHLASAIQAQIEIFDTFDMKLLKLSGKLGNPSLTVCEPDLPY